MPGGSPNGQHPDLNRKPHPLAGTWEALKSAKLVILLVALGLAFAGLAAFINMRTEATPEGMLHSSAFGSTCSSVMVTLATGLVISGALKLLLDNYQESKKKRDEQHEFRERLLEDIRDVYLRVERARLLISAHNSAKAYNDQISHLIGCQATLLRVKRSLDLRLDDKDVRKGEDCFADIVGYLRALQNEYAINYTSIAASQSPCDLTKLPVLDDLTGCGNRFRCMLVGPLGVLAARIVERDILVLGKGAVKRAEGIPELDKEFDRLVEERAEIIQSMCWKDIREQKDRDQQRSCRLDAAATSQAN